MGTRVFRPGVRGLALAGGFLVVSGGLVVAVVMAFGPRSQQAFAQHAGPGGHGIQLECTPDPFEVSVGDEVTVTYVVRNGAGVVKPPPDHGVTFTLTDDWVGDIIDPNAGGNQTDTLLAHASPSASTFTEGVDQVTYTRTFTVGDVLLNTVVLTGDFDDEHLASASVQCNLELIPPTPTPTPTRISEVSPTITVPPPTPTPTRITEVLGPPTGNGPESGPSVWLSAGLVSVLVVLAGSMATLGYRRLR